jgi:hypothetical protein
MGQTIVFKSPADATMLINDSILVARMAPKHEESPDKQSPPLLRLFTGLPIPDARYLIGAV